MLNCSKASNRPKTTRQKKNLTFFVSHKITLPTHWNLLLKTANQFSLKTLTRSWSNHQTKLTSPHFQSEIQAQKTTINITVTLDDLEEQFLSKAATRSIKIVWTTSCKRYTLQEAESYFKTNLRTKKYWGKKLTSNWYKHSTIMRIIWSNSTYTNLGISHIHWILEIFLLIDNSVLLQYTYYNMHHIFINGIVWIERCWTLYEWDKIFKSPLIISITFINVN